MADLKGPADLEGRVWQPGEIGPLQLPHRIVMGSMHLGLEGVDPAGELLAAFYAERVRGGAALVVTGGSAVSKVGAGGVNYSFVNEESDWPKLARVAAAVHDAGGRVLLQLFHAGRYALEGSFGLRPVAPSAVYSALSRCEPRALLEEEILETVSDFARGAARALELGFDGVELMGSEGYLINQFTAPLTNLREDAWGGDVDGRLRFPLAVAAAVREAVGSAGAVVFRVSGVDLVPDGTPAADVTELARRLVAGGFVDALNVGVGWHEARVPTVQGVVPKGTWSPYARAVREVVDVPVIASNRVNTVRVAEDVLARGDADFISMARPFLADPSLVARSRDGGRVNVCIACNQCIETAILDRRVSCVVNPRAGFEAADAAIRAPLGGARIAVVGGGPAGMEAARSLAAAGFDVVLLEAAERIGGQFRMACRIPGKEDFEGTIDYFEEELVRLGVAVQTGAAVESVNALSGFDAVVVATGVTPRTVDLPGAELPHVVSYAELLLGDPSLAREALSRGPVAIVGAGGIGVDVAHLLCSLAATGSAREFYERYRLEPFGRAAPVGADAAARAMAAGVPQITLMRRHGRIGDGVGPVSRWVVVQELQLAGVELLTDLEYERIEPDAVVIRTADGAARRIEATTVVIAAGQEPRTSLTAELRAAGQPHVVIGGSASAERLDAGRAFRQGLEVPAAVARALAAV